MAPGVGVGTGVGVVMIGSSVASAAASPPSASGTLVAIGSGVLSAGASPQAVDRPRGRDANITAVNRIIDFLIILILLFYCVSQTA
jgi:hypothetical protein